MVSNRYVRRNWSPGSKVLRFSMERRSGVNCACERTLWWLSCCGLIIELLCLQMMTPMVGKPSGETDPSKFSFTQPSTGRDQLPRVLHGYLGSMLSFCTTVVDAEGSAICETLSEGVRVGSWKDKEFLALPNDPRGEVGWKSGPN